MVFDTLHELAQHSIGSFSNDIAFAMLGGQELTFREVGERMTQVQQLLSGAGIKAGDKVALLSSNMPNWGVCYLAATSAAMVVVPILPDFSTDELTQILIHSEAKALLVSDKLYSKLSKQSLAEMNIVIRTKNLGVISQKVKCDDPAPIVRPAKDDLAAIIYTSGTTSSPKGVMLSHRALCNQVEICRTMFELNREDSCLSVLPLSHVYECSVGMLYPFFLGARVTYLERAPSASTLLPALKSVQPTVFLIVPLLIEKIYRSQVKALMHSNPVLKWLTSFDFVRKQFHRMAGRKLMKMFGGRLRIMGIAGAKLDYNTEKFLLEAKVPYAIGYGLTETAPLLAGAIPANVRLGSTGIVPSQIKVRLDDVNPETGQGEVVALTPCVMDGYYKNPEATAAVFTADGWFRTGDIGEFDSDGWLYIRGRIKNMILGASGENIYPEDIETVLNSHVCISDSLVTERDGRLIALVHFDTAALEHKFETLKEEWEQKREELESQLAKLQNEVKEYANAKLNRFSKISEVVILKEEFIKTPTQKIKRFLYQRTLQSGEGLKTT